MGLRLRDLCRSSNFNWCDLRAIVRRARTDPAMELYRAWNPDTWVWSEPTALLAAEIATMISDLRYFEALHLNWEGKEVPERYLPARYGPPQSHDKPADDTEHFELTEEEVERSRQVAASMR